MDVVEILKDQTKIFNTEILSLQDATNKYGKTTFSEPVALDAAVVINDIEEISLILKLANKYLFNIYPVSTNNNWGYGSFNVSDNRPNVILDFSKLKKIIPTSKELGLVTVQPGVTQQQLYDFLTKNNWQYMVPVTGAGPTCSLLSNALERGYGITPHNDHFYACTALKAYLPHPEFCERIYESAISAIDKSGEDFTDKTYKWGLGPYIDGLFTQSNLAIVTEMTIRLAPIPKYFCAFYLQIPKSESFEDAVSLIKDTLKNYSGIVGSINLMDQRRLISITSENPNGHENGKLMTESQIAKESENKKLPQWMVVGSMYGDKDIVKASKKLFRKKAKKLGTVFYSDSLLIRLADFFLKFTSPNNNFLGDTKQKLESLREGIDIMLGIPNQVALPLPYWRNAKIRPDKSKIMSPSKDECGLLWYAPLIKMEPQSLSKFVDFVRKITPLYGIEPLITFTNLKHDCVDSTVPLVFNLSNATEVKNAHSCLDHLINEGAKYGFVPYRLDTTQQKKLESEHIFWETTDLIKSTLDPNRILAPNRYNP
ncbi:FAD-binding protein [Paraglaciecola sp. 25GB23A]|uniref:FAD-binding oxidoreductase n=1 Tax=Paraglaciecola sp. 25GB23A TaxID=3156068 RepID=UPI0032AF3FFE